MLQFLTNSISELVGYQIMLFLIWFLSEKFICSSRGQNSTDGWYAFVDLLNIKSIKTYFQGGLTEWFLGGSGHLSSLWHQHIWIAHGLCLNWLKSLYSYSDWPLLLVETNFLYSDWGSFSRWQQYCSCARLSCLSQGKWGCYPHYFFKIPCG